MTARAIAVLLLAGTLLPAVSCAPKGSSMDPGTRTPIREGGGAGGGDGAARGPAWFPRAVDLRVHPATRYVVDKGELILEARVELLDQAGEPIKDVGRFVCEIGEVDDAGQVVGVGGRQRLLHFELDVLSAEDHQAYWDPVARTYVLPLELGEADADLPGRVTRLWVTFRPAWPGAAQVPESTEGRGPVEVRVDW